MDDFSYVVHNRQLLPFTHCVCGYARTLYFLISNSYVDIFTIMLYNTYTLLLQFWEGLYEI